MRRQPARIRPAVDDQPPTPNPNADPTGTAMKYIASQVPCHPQPSGALTQGLMTHESRENNRHNISSFSQQGTRDSELGADLRIYATPTQSRCAG